MNDGKPIDPSPESTTKDIEYQESRRGNTVIRIIDTPGLQKKEKEKRKQLKKLTRFKVDLLIYCITVAPGNRFADINPATMKTLQDVFGTGIWNNCVVVFTYSNLAWGHFISSTDQEETAIDKYKAYINDYAATFQQELNRLKVFNKEARTVFNLPPHPRPPHPEENGDITIIPVIPAGFKVQDRVLADLEAVWTDTVFLEMIEKCKDEHKMAFLQYRYGEETAKKVKMMLGGSGGGALTVAGALVGILVGIVGGPLGMALGGAIGATAGLMIGTAAVVTGGIAASISSNE
jgi:hypothetical protein